VSEHWIELLGLCIIPLAGWVYSIRQGRVKELIEDAVAKGATEARAEAQRAATRALHERLSRIEARVDRVERRDNELRDTLAGKGVIRLTHHD
jgi:hypothetical protein